MAQPSHDGPVSAATFRGTLSGDGRPGPIEERLGRRLIRLIDPESDEHMVPADQLGRPRQEIESEVRRIAQGVDGVRSVTHVLVHFLDRRVALQVDIEVDPALLVRDAATLARSLRGSLESISGVDCADIHLELDDLAHRELPAPLQGSHREDAQNTRGYPGRKS